ncbi:DUF6924 domain-containing protein [Actinomadura algeriensis]|uniref:DUF6924 domain-containing protein n=1 Tax=Actinomadura algeriensis TaxID=1679523 RepID=A0ABR9JTD0_9ACTN|nr:hypothetical protein [Actinomadura algeriensis]MBE1533654.1 hypothetical protein [Actinomadura algeriensis]
MLVIRTDFSDQRAWEAVRAALGSSDYMEPPHSKEDRSYEGLSVEDVLARLPVGTRDPFIAVVDKTTIDSPEMPVMLVDLNEWRGQYGRTFRVVPRELPSIEVNLSLANMDFFEFADSADDDGVFRGFRD